MGIPENREARAGGHTVTVSERERIVITGVEEVASFDETSVVMTTNRGQLTLDGTGLNITRLDLDNGEVTVGGELVGLYYMEPRRERGRRLLGRR